MMPDQNLFFRRHAFGQFVIFFANYIFYLGCKLFFYIIQPGEDFYLALFFLNIFELLMWIGISRCYFPTNSVGAGVVILYVCMSLYVIVPVAMLSYGIDIFPFSHEVIRLSMFGQSIALTHIFFFFHLLIRPSLILRANSKLILWFQLCKPTPAGGGGVAFLGLFISLAYYYNFSSSGVADLIGNESRSVIARTAETGKTWLLQYVFFAWLMVVVAMLLLKRNCLELRYAFPVIVFSILLFLYVYVSIGNRRELALFLVFVLLLSVGFKKNILTFAIVAAFPVLLALGLIRALSGASLDEFDLTTNLLNLFGEFVFPHYALLYYSSLPSFQFEFGRSFFLLPAYAFPSFGLWEKSKSLSVQFAYDFSNLDMGYALTPLAEGYINFGWSAMVLSPLLLALSLVLAMRFANIAPFTLLIIFSFPLDISRGEFTTIFFQFVIFSFVFYLVAELFQFKVSRIGK